jgi:hypothetical protein
MIVVATTSKDAARQKATITPPLKVRLGTMKGSMVVMATDAKTARMLQPSATRET